MGDNLILFPLDTMNSNVYSSLYIDKQNVVKEAFASTIPELIE